MTEIKVKGYKRVQKRTAKRLYSHGIDIYLVPCKVRPDDDGMWIRPYKINPAGSGDFDTNVNAFNYYSCSDAELGTYPAFYIKEDICY